MPPCAFAASCCHRVAAVQANRKFLRSRSSATQRQLGNLTPSAPGGRRRGTATSARFGRSLRGREPRCPPTNTSIHSFIDLLHWSRSLPIGSCLRFVKVHGGLLQRHTERGAGGRLRGEERVEKPSRDPKVPPQGPPLRPRTPGTGCEAAAKERGSCSSELAPDSSSDCSSAARTYRAGKAGEGEGRLCGEATT